MTRRRDDATRLLRWYPPRWRARYGEEFAAYVEDSLNGARPTTRFVVSIALGALRERGHQSGLMGRTASPPVKSRAGSLLVLCAWSVFILAGASFSKLSEHFARAMPAGTGSLARVGFDVVATCGALGMILVLLGATVAVPSFVGFLRDGGWAVARRRLLIATALSGLALGALVPLALWAHHLTTVQRNGGDGLYSFAFVTWAVVLALSVMSWVRLVVHCVAKMELSPRILRLEARIATTVSLLMVTITAGAAFWWAEVATNAPWFLQGARYGTSSSPLSPLLLFTLAAMAGASLAGVFGLTRIVRAWRVA